jgi:uncharacterized membrane protein
MLFLFVLACSGGEPVETGSYSVCDPTFPVSWDNFGEGFIATNCNGCHASGTRDRNGAPESVTFDTEYQAMTQADDILRTVVDSETMPPAGGVIEEDLLLLDLWLGCFAE